MGDRFFLRFNPADDESLQNLLPREILDQYPTARLDNIFGSGIPRAPIFRRSLIERAFANVLQKPTTSTPHRAIRAQQDEPGLSPITMDNDEVITNQPLEDLENVENLTRRRAPNQSLSREQSPASTGSPRVVLFNLSKAENIKRKQRQTQTSESLQKRAPKQRTKSTARQTQTTDSLQRIYNAKHDSDVPPSEEVSEGETTVEKRSMGIQTSNQSSRASQRSLKRENVSLREQPTSNRKVKILKTSILKQSRVQNTFDGLPETPDIKRDKSVSNSRNRGLCSFVSLPETSDKNLQANNKSNKSAATSCFVLNDVPDENNEFEVFNNFYVSPARCGKVANNSLHRSHTALNLQKSSERNLTVPNKSYKAASLNCLIEAVDEARRESGAGNLSKISEQLQNKSIRSILSISNSRETTKETRNRLFNPNDKSTTLDSVQNRGASAVQQESYRSNHCEGESSAWSTASGASALRRSTRPTATPNFYVTEDFKDKTGRSQTKSSITENEAEAHLNRILETVGIEIPSKPCCDAQEAKGSKRQSKNVASCRTSQKSNKSTTNRLTIQKRKETDQVKHLKQKVKRMFPNGMSGGGGYSSCSNQSEGSEAGLSVTTRMSTRTRKKPATYNLAAVFDTKLYRQYQPKNIPPPIGQEEDAVFKKPRGTGAVRKTKGKASTSMENSVGINLYDHTILQDLQDLSNANSSTKSQMQVELTNKGTPASAPSKQVVEIEIQESPIELIVDSVQQTEEVVAEIISPRAPHQPTDQEQVVAAVQPIEEKLLTAPQLVTAGNEQSPVRSIAGQSRVEVLLRTAGDQQAANITLGTSFDPDRILTIGKDGIPVAEKYYYYADSTILENKEFAVQSSGMSNEKGAISGNLYVKIGCAKPIQCSGNYDLFFFVVKGVCQATICGRTKVFETGDGFRVPSTKEYAIKNLGNEILTLSFLKLKQ